MNIKIIQHIMPWDIDNSHLSFIQLKKSKYYLPEGVGIKIETVLNLSSYMINWEDSSLPKSFFIQKYKDISNLLVDYDHVSHIYEGDKLYGHLNFQKETIDEETDHYITICPDMYFSEYLLSYIIQSASQIPNKYFVITPQIPKLWDHTWDEISHEDYNNLEYDGWNKLDIFDVRYNSKIKGEEITLSPTYRSKWAGWFDLYSKSMYEELCPFHDEWEGYGPWDWYSLIITEKVKSMGVDFQQYLLKGEIIFEYPIGPLKDRGFTEYYKDHLVKNPIPNQREQFESKMNLYLQKTFNILKEKNII